LSFTSRKTASLGFTIAEEEWWAIAATALSSDTITLTASTFNAHEAFQLVVWGITGANTANPFDPNGALPATNSGNPTMTPNVLVSTSNPNDMLLGLIGEGGFAATYTAGSGLTLIDSPGAKSGLAEFQVVSSTQSGVTVTLGANPGQDWVMIGDAVQAAPPTRRPCISEGVPLGSNVQVNFPSSVGSLMFSQVTGVGEVDACSFGNPGPVTSFTPASGFRTFTGGDAFAFTGPVTVSLSFLILPGQTASGAHLYELVGGSWVDITTSATLDTSSPCGCVGIATGTTNTLGVFVVGYP
jgi:hypothetical protein